MATGQWMAICHSKDVGSVLDIPWSGGDTQTLPYAKEFCWTFCTDRCHVTQPSWCPGTSAYAIARARTWAVLVLLKFEVNSQKQKLTEFLVWIGNCDVKVRKSTEEKLHKIWNSNFFAKIQENEHTPGLVKRSLTIFIQLACSAQLFSQIKKTTHLA